MFQITLKKGYDLLDLKNDLAALYQKAGTKNVGIVFLMTDAQASHCTQRITSAAAGGGPVLPPFVCLLSVCKQNNFKKSRAHFKIKFKLQIDFG